MLKTLKLTNFRNHLDFTIDFDRITVITGRNGAGKSNILEALAMLSFCRSFRDTRKQDMVNIGSDFARISTGDAELVFAREPQFTLKGKIKGVPRKLTEFVGFTPAVAFSPETLAVITGAPAFRRRFLDIMMSQVDKEYLAALVGYEKIKKQRNQLLRHLKRNQAEVSELNFWDGELVKFAEILSAKRAETVVFISQFLAPIYQQISQQKSTELFVRYIKNYDDLAATLVQHRSRDIADENTQHGPHRDDLVFELNGLEMANYASRGEIKSAILALKIGEMKFIEDRRKANPAAYEKTAPILLLDDIFSEFDSGRRKHLVSLLDDYQTVITATGKENLPEDLVKRAKVIELK